MDLRLDGEIPQLDVVDSNPVSRLFITPSNLLLGSWLPVLDILDGFQRAALE